MGFRNYVENINFIFIEFSDFDKSGKRKISKNGELPIGKHLALPISSSVQSHQFKALIGTLFSLWYFVG